MNDVCLARGAAMSVLVLVVFLFRYTLTFLAKSRVDIGSSGGRGLSMIGRRARVGVTNSATAATIATTDMSATT